MPGMPTIVEDEKGQLLAYLDQHEGLYPPRRLRAHRGAGAAQPLGQSAEHRRADQARGEGGAALDGDRARASGEPDSESYEEGFRLGPDESLEGMLDFYESVAAETERVVTHLPSNSRCRCPRVFRGSRRTSTPGTSGGWCSISSRRPRATRATPTSCASRSTERPGSRSCPPPRTGTCALGSSPGSRRPAPLERRRPRRSAPS